MRLNFLVKALLQILKPHNRKEEQIMYLMVDQAADKDAPALLAQAKSKLG